jgi:hypothetical protein
VLKAYLSLGGKAEKWSACEPTHSAQLNLDKAREVLRWRQSDVFTDWSATFWSTPRR